LTTPLVSQKFYPSQGLDNGPNFAAPPTATA
jgi:hypothetical protein